MKYNKNGHGTGGDVPPSIRLEIKEELRGGGGSTSFFEPRRERTPGSSGRGGGRDPPEKRLTLFALRLAVLEKAATGLGKLDFVWATVVLLGGFASTLRIMDFWCVTVILLSEGARVFSRSHELEWQHHATPQLRSSSRFLRRVTPDAVARRGDDRRAAAQFQRRIADLVRRRTWNAQEVSLLPYTGWVFVSRKAGRVLYWLQVASALACVALSSTRLWKHDFGAGDGARNRRPALLLFYTLALLEASLFLLEKAYWAWKLSVRRLLHQVSAECGLGTAYGPAALTRFFYDAYSRCIAGSVFDGIKMDLVAFAEDLVLSDFLDEQLIGARILQQLASNSGNDDTLREVGTSPRVVERLVEILNWKRPDEEEVRRCAAEVVSRLAGRRQNVLRVSAIPGAIESVMSLLHTDDQVDSGYDHLPFNLLGLLILKRLARDHDNCGKMGSTRGLLAKIIDFTRVPPAILRNPHAPESQLRAVKRALQLVKMLASATGSTGRALRHEIAENVFSVSHLRGILRHGQGQRRHRELQKLAIDVLTGLAVEETGKHAVVSTGGTVKLLLSVFVDEDSRELASEAGEALATLALGSRAACAAILKTAPDRDVIGRVVLPALQIDGDPRRLNATRLLRNLCAYSGSEDRDLLREATEALPAALKATMAPEESDKVIEASVGLTAEICGLLFIDGGERFGVELHSAGFDERAYVEKLAGVLRRYTYPEMRVPRMRRFVVQQLIWLMTTGPGGGYVELLREAGMEQQLESIADTTSGLECYHVFSGSVGIGKHCDNFSSMVETAIELLAARGGSRPED